MTESAGRLVGRTISHYRIVAPLGAGGMGVIYRGEDVRLGRPVAIKFVADDVAHDPQAVARLRTEARAASALNHPNICTIYDIGTDDGRPFIVMEMIEGHTLRDRLGRGHLKVHELVDVGIQIADALQAAHSAGILHRDIKPANIFLNNRGHVKLLDFGLAKLTTLHPGADSETTLGSRDLTAAGTTLGTVAYMSPEQAAGEELDGRTDLFSLGVVLYECATGRQPFEGKTHALILSAILNRAPVPPGALNQELPPRLQEIILTCLEKDRELRYQNAADLRADLKRVRRDLESGRMHATTAALSSSPAVSASTEPYTGSATIQVSGTTSAAPPIQERTRSRMPLVTAALLVIALGVVGGFTLWRRQAPPPTQAPGAGQTASAPAPSAESIQNTLALAQTSFDAANYRAAQAYASEVLAAQPNQPDALTIQRDATARLEQFEQAISVVRQRLASGDVQAAARALVDARQLDPTSPVVSELAATLAQRVGATASTATSGNAATTGSAAPRRSAAQAATAQSRVEGQAAAPPPATPVMAAPQQAAPLTAVPAPPSAPAPSAASAAPSASTADHAAVTPERPAAPPGPPAPGSNSATASPSDRATRSTAPESPSPADEEAAVRRVVATYARAIENKDVTLFRSVKPNLSREEERRLQDGFRAVNSQQVQLTLTAIEVRGQDASVVAQRRDTIDAGGRRQTVDTRQTFRLTRTPAGWVITDIR